MPTNARTVICRGNEQPFSIEEIMLSDLQPNEVRIRIASKSHD